MSGFCYFVILFIVATATARKTTHTLKLRKNASLLHGLTFTPESNVQFCVVKAAKQGASTAKKRNKKRRGNAER
jgi:hypothetical protein